MTKKWFIFLVLVVLLAACAPAAPVETAGIPMETEAASMGEEAADEEEKDVPGTQAEPAVIFERSGGLAGRIETWAIYPDGRVVGPNGQEYLTEPERVDELVAEIEELGFFDLEDSYGRSSGCRDCFNITLTVNGEAQSKTVSVVPEANDVPQAMPQIMERIDNLVVGLQQ